jgi:hypothetical protein
MMNRAIGPKASSTVAGKRSTISDETFRPWRSDRPNSPCSALPTKAANWTGPYYSVLSPASYNASVRIVTPTILV